MVSCGWLQRVDAAKSRIEGLNPLVAVETMTSPTALEREGFDALLQGVDLVCVTDSERDFLVSGRVSRLPRCV
jgi:ubiquitin-like 1-activating enzyme E1 A